MTSRNSKSLLILSFVVLVALLAVLAFVLYDIRTKNLETSELLEKTNGVAESEILAQTVRIARNSAPLELTAFDTFVFSGEKLVPFIENIEEIGRSLGLTTEIASVNRVPGDKKASEPDTVHLVIESDGPWTSIFTFVRTFENYPHHVMIDDMNLSRSENDWHLRIIISLHSFD